jgi:hypothetical protein
VSRTGVRYDDSLSVCFITLTDNPKSFGELSQFIRRPNGDLEVHFRDNEVADTVGIAYHLRRSSVDVLESGLSFERSRIHQRCR